MFSICKQTHPASGIEHSISCHFFDNIEENLVTAADNILKVFQIVPDIKPNSNEEFSDESPPKMHLNCVATFQLFGNIMSIKSAKLVGFERDALLMSFQDAKLSVVVFDPSTHELETFSIHSYEDDDMKSGWTTDKCMPLLRVDPENRCAVMLVCDRALAVLPFKSYNLDEMSGHDDKPMKLTSWTDKYPIQSSYIISLRDMNVKIQNIIDMQFLHDYNEPTLLILYEPVRTHAGRLAVRRDTCSIAVISLNINLQVHPIVWSMDNLPFDCKQLLPITKPIGGCLVICTNSIIVLNQGVQPYGVSLNSTAEQTTSFPLKIQNDVAITLDEARFVFIKPNRLIMSLGGGDLYVITLYASRLRENLRFQFDKVASSGLSNCMCLCHEEYLFLGSRLGNSLLLRFTTQTSKCLDDNKENMEIETDPPLQNMSENKELVVSGSDFAMELCDSIINIGPITFMAAGFRASELLAEDTEANENVSTNDLEIVTASGSGKNGALCILQNSIRPKIITSFRLSGCLNVWTVYDESKKNTESNLHHAYMILSLENSTNIFKTGNKLNKMDNSGFCSTLPTIFVGNLGENRYIIQVTTQSILLLKGSAVIQNIPMDQTLINVSICDPYVCILTSDGSVITMVLKKTKDSTRLAINKRAICNSPPIIALSAYRDSSGLFTTENNELSQDSSDFKFIKTEKVFKMDTEEESLYRKDVKTEKKETENTIQKWWRRFLHSTKPTYWVLVLRNDGSLEIYSLPVLKIMFLAANPGNCELIFPGSSKMESVLDVPTPQEVLLVGLGSHGTIPTLFLRVQSEIVIYQVIKSETGHLKIRFKKMSHSIINPFKTPNNEESSQYSNKIRYFDNISGYSGVAICGDRPFFVFLSKHGELHSYRLSNNTPITGFAAFNTVNCANGLIYFDQNCDLKIATFPKHQIFDGDWLVQKVPLHSSPRHIVYHLERKLYCFVKVSQSVTGTFCRFSYDGLSLETVQNKIDKRSIFPSIMKFEILLFSPNRFEIVPEERIELNLHERVVALKIVLLSSDETRSGLKEYICIGTDYNYGEDIASLGRILIYDIIEVVPELEKPLTRFKFKKVCEKVQLRDVTAVTHVLGHLVAAVGNKIFLWQLIENDLIGVSFIDANLFVVDMVSINSFILVSDYQQSISIIRYQDKYRALSVVSSDYRKMIVYSIQYIVDDTDLGFLVTDNNQNLHVFMFEPENRNSFGGQKLIRKADYNLRQNVNSMFRIKCNLGDAQLERCEYKHKQLTMFGTLSGGIGYVLPLPEKTYKRLTMLQNVLFIRSERICGLSPKWFRTINGLRQEKAVRCIIDGEVVFSFFNLPFLEKQLIADKIGSSIEDIRRDLAEIYKASSIF